MALLQVLTVVLFLAVASDAKVYGKCEFVNYLLQHGFNKNELGVWSCIAKHESEYNTQAINHNTGDYGILQISSIYWCNLGLAPGKACGITCQSLLGDDISVDLDCAKKVFAETTRLRGNGFTAWTTYQYCKGDVSQYVAGCF